MGACACFYSLYKAELLYQPNLWCHDVRLSEYSRQHKYSYGLNVVSVAGKEGKGKSVVDTFCGNIFG